MNNVLSLTGGSNSGGWRNDEPLTADLIDKIDDGQQGNTKNQPTSIPSPFARIDLVLTAFKNITLGRINPNSEKLISKVFDLGELLFNYDSVKDKLEIAKWTIKNDDGWVATSRLQESSRKGNKRFGKVLQMFLEQDAKTYKFNDLKHIHIISYGGNVIGGTSPVTLFFTTPNEDYFNEINIKFGTHKLFDTERYYVPLFERDAEYQKVWYYLSKKYYTEFNNKFKPVAEYIEMSIKNLKEKNRKVYDTLFENGNLIIDEDYAKNNYIPLDTGKKNDIIDILGIPFYKKNSNLSKGKTLRQSQFIINSQKYKGDLTPMVLQRNFSKPYQYTDNANWIAGTNVPLYVNESWKNNERKLPGLTQNYPWLTVNDLLEPHIVKLNFPVNKNKFFLGKEEGIGDNEAYLPPLKKDFFEFFDIADLELNKVSYKIIKMPAGEIGVELGIPINGGNDKIIFEKIYSPIPVGTNNIDLSDETKNDGKNVGNTAYIVDVPFNVVIYPPMRSGTVNIAPDYSIQLVRETENSLVSDISLDFYNESLNQEVQTRMSDKNQSSKYRSNLNSGFFPTKYYKVTEEFDIISLQLQNNNISITAPILPKFTKYNGGADQYSVAFDFGTTNSHVEISINGLTPQALQIDSSQVVSLSVLSTKTYPLELYFSSLYEFVPERIGKSGEYSFPIRTVVSETSNIVHNAQDLELFSDFNIPFYFEKENKRKIDNLHTNLKWAQIGNNSYNHTKFFLEELVLLVRNKILMDGGNLSSTKIIWTFPSSMKRAQQNQLGRIWTTIIEKYFGKSILEPERGQLISVMESLAPFYHYKKIQPRLIGLRPVVSIDIGGGTTDTVIYHKGAPIALTSFRFAGNAIFGDGFLTEAADSNGFILRYKEHFEELLSKNRVGNLSGYNGEVNKTKNSENIISFWFSVEKHPAVKNRDLFSFNTRLANDEDMKIIFILFYTAIIYHIVKIMKDSEEQLELPGGFIFSGTGSKILQIITTEEKLLTEYSKIIIEKIYGKKYDKNSPLNVFSDTETPKEATCKGVLRMTEEDYQNKPKTLVYSGIGTNPFEPITYEQANSVDLMNMIVADVETFFKFFFELSKEFSFEDEFGVSPLAIKIAKEELPKSLLDYVSEAINMKSRGLDDLDKNLEDTLFFYPIIGAINNLAYAISQRTSLK